MHPIAKFSTATGDWWLPTDNDVDIVIKAIKSGDFFEEDIVSAARKFITPGSVVLDVGANFGQMTVAFARMVGPEGRVHAFEADEFVFDLLLRNIDANNCANVTPHFGAVWKDDGLVLYYPEPDFERFGSYGSYGIDLNASSGRQVKSCTIDGLNIDGPVSVIKVDIQGSDLFAMMGARQLIGRDKPVIIFEFEEQFLREFGTTYEDYMNFIADIDYVIAEEVGRIRYVRNFVALPRPTHLAGWINIRWRQFMSMLKNKRLPK